MSVWAKCGRWVIAPFLGVELCSDGIDSLEIKDTDRALERRVVTEWAPLSITSSLSFNGFNRVPVSGGDTYCTVFTCQCHLERPNFVIPARENV